MDRPICPLLAIRCWEGRSVDASNSDVAKSLRAIHSSLELARYRIKLFLDKSEEWSMFDLSADHAATVKWEKARTFLQQR